MAQSLRADAYILQFARSHRRFSRSALRQHIEGEQLDICEWVGYGGKRCIFDFLEALMRLLAPHIYENLEQFNYFSRTTAAGRPTVNHDIENRISSRAEATDWDKFSKCTLSGALNGARVLGFFELTFGSLGRRMLTDFTVGNGLRGRSESQESQQKFGLSAYPVNFCVTAAQKARIAHQDVSEALWAGVAIVLFGISEAIRTLNNIQLLLVELIGATIGATLGAAVGLSRLGLRAWYPASQQVHAAAVNVNA